MNRLSGQGGGGKGAALPQALLGSLHLPNSLGACSIKLEFQRVKKPKAFHERTHYTGNKKCHFLPQLSWVYSVNRYQQDQSSGGGGGGGGGVSPV